MVFYIIACHKENLRESQVADIVKNQVLRENNRNLGELYDLTEGVSFALLQIPLG
jgi:hypothetical protein